MLTDFHTHAFPDDLAPRAMAALEPLNSAAGYHDATLGGLLGSMDRAGIDRAVICSIATRPTQFDAIVAWCQSIASPRIVPLASVHPADPRAVERLGAVQAAGLRGIKLHPYYQDYVLDGDEAYALYAAAADLGLLIVSHCGHDIGFAPDDRAEPARIRRVVDRFPGLDFVVSHLGGWRQWDEAARHLLGAPVWIESSMALAYTDEATVRRLIDGHDPQRLLFGSDSPWGCQSSDLARWRALVTDEARLTAMLGGNAARLLGG